MALITRPTLVSGASLPTLPNAESPRTTRSPITLTPRNRGGDFHYTSIHQTAWITWLAVLISAGLHALLLLGFNGHVAVHRVLAHEDPVDQIQMMPILDDPEENKVKDLEDNEQDTTPSVSVPMLADIPTLVPLSASFVQPLDLTIPLKADPNAGQVIAIPVNIQRGKLDETGIKNLFNLSELDRRPEPIVQTAPTFPFEMKRQGISARVHIRFIVNSDGEVIRPFILSSTYPGFDRAALEAIKRWKFRPGIKNGRKVNTRVEQPMDFNALDEK